MSFEDAESSSIPENPIIPEVIWLAFTAGSQCGKPESNFGTTTILLNMTCLLVVHKTKHYPNCLIQTCCEMSRALCPGGGLSSDDDHHGRETKPPK